MRFRDATGLKRGHFSRHGEGAWKLFCAQRPASAPLASRAEGDGYDKAGDEGLAHEDEGLGDVGGSKRIHLEEESGPEPECPLCASLVKQGRNRVRARVRDPCAKP